MINTFSCQTLVSRICGKNIKSNRKTINLHGMRYLNYLMHLILYQIIKTIKEGETFTDNSLIKIQMKLHLELRLDIIT